MKQVNVNISPEGEVEIDVQGVSGPTCLALTEGIERALGRMTVRDSKPEMHQHDHASQKQSTDHRY